MPNAYLYRSMPIKILALIPMSINSDLLALIDNDRHWEAFWINSMILIGIDLHWVLIRGVLHLAVNHCLLENPLTSLTSVVVSLNWLKSKCLFRKWKDTLRLVLHVGMQHYTWYTRKMLLSALNSFLSMSSIMLYFLTINLYIQLPIDN